MFHWVWVGAHWNPRYIEVSKALQPPPSTLEPVRPRRLSIFAAHVMISPKLTWLHGEPSHVNLEEERISITTGPRLGGASLGLGQDMERDLWWLLRMAHQPASCWHWCFLLGGAWGVLVFCYLCFRTSDSDPLTEADHGSIRREQTTEVLWSYLGLRVGCVPCHWGVGQ